MMLIPFFLANIIQVFLVVGTHRSPAEKYLLGTGELFKRWLNTRRINDNPALRSLFVEQLNGAITNAIASALPDLSLSKLAQTLEDRMRYHDGFTLLKLSAVLMASGNIDMSASLDFFTPLSGSRSLALASRIGMSIEKIGLIFLVLEINGGLADRLNLIESKIVMLGGVNDGPVVKEISQLMGPHLSPFHSRLRAMCAELRLMNHLVPQLISLELIQEVQQLTGHAHNYVALGSSVSETCRVLLYHMLEIMVQITPEQAGVFSVQISAIWDAIENIRLANYEVLEFNYAGVIVDQLNPLLDELKRHLIAPTSEGVLRIQESTLLSELNGLEDVDPALNIVLIPKIKAFIKFTCLVHLNPEPFMLLQIMIRAMVRVIIQESEVTTIFRKRIAISSFIDSFFESFSGFAHSTGSEYEAYVIECAFRFARKFGFRLLAEYPQLLPGWSLEKITLVRKILASFLFVDGPYDWESSGITVLLSLASEAQLRKAVSVVSSMHEIRRSDQSQNFDRAPLYTPGSWLRDFFANPLEAPTHYVSLIQGIAQKPCLQPLFRDIFFPEFNPLLMEFIVIPEKFILMANRINSISLQYRAGSDHRLESALSLPRQLLRVEMDTGVIHASEEESPIVNLVEQSVNAFFSVMEAFGRLEPDSLIMNDHALSRCLHSLSAIINNDIIGMEQNESHIQAVQTLIADMNQLTQALASNVEFVGNPLCILPIAV